MTDLRDTSFALAEGSSPDTLAQHLRRAFGLRLHHGLPQRSVYYDTFDARLGRRGASLGIQAPNGSSCLHWQADGRTLRVQTHGPVPAFAHELPEGPLRQALGPLIDVRRLLPLMELEGESTQFELLDDEDKVVVRLQLDDVRTRDAQGQRPWQKLPPLLHVRPLRGYPREAAQLEALLAELPGLRPVEGGTVAAALASLGLDRHAAATLTQPALAPDMRADLGLRRVLLFQLDTLELHLDGVRRDLDTEFLHDVRVALRRTRALLGALAGVLPEAEAQHAAAELAWFGQATGPCRDLDVFLNELRGCQQALGDVQLQPIVERVVAQRESARAAMLRDLESERAAALLGGWRAFLLSPEPGVEAPFAASRLRSFVAGHIARLQHKLVRRRHLELGAPAHAWHRVRLHAKKLRYLLDCFAGLFEPEALERALKELRRLQTALGTANDASLQEARLRGLAEGLPPAACVDLGRLVQHLRRTGLDARALAVRHMASFGGKKARKSFEHLLRETEA